MASVYLILGGNLGDRFCYMEQARVSISERIGAIRKFSSFYETEPWGFSHDQLFLNQVFEVDTKLNPFEMLECINDIELNLGRVRNKDRYSSRTIDIDILFYDDLVIVTPALTIPHPEMTKRRFVLEPLAEIASEIVHPVLKKTIRQLLLDCEDLCKVYKVT